MKTGAFSSRVLIFKLAFSPRDLKPSVFVSSLGEETSRVHLKLLFKSTFGFDFS